MAGIASMSRRQGSWYSIIALKLSTNQHTSNTELKIGRSREGGGGTWLLAIQKHIEKTEIFRDYTF